MAATLAPKTCPEDAWKTWLKDGARLALRGGTGWGLLWLALFLGRGWLIEQVWLTIVLMAALSGVVELAHLATMATVAEGKVGLGASLRAIGQLIQGQGPLLGRTVLARFQVAVVTVLIFGGVYLLFKVMVSSPTTPPAAAPAPTLLGEVYAWIKQSATVTYMALMLRHRNVFSFVLPLMRDHGLGTAQALDLHDQAFQKNPWMADRFAQPWRLAMIVAIIALPFLLPFLELWLAGVMTCAYADVFGDGYEVKALAKFRVPGFGGRAALSGV